MSHYLPLLLFKGCRVYRMLENSGASVSELLVEYQSEFK